MVVERLGEREAERDAIVVARARIGERCADAIDVGRVELRRLEIGQAPPRHAGVGLRRNDAAVFGRRFLCVVADAQHVRQQRARGDMIGCEADGFLQRDDGLVMAHATRQQHAEVVPGDRKARLQLAAAAQRRDRGVVFARFGEHGAERVLVERIVRPLRDGAAHRVDRGLGAAAQAFDAGEEAQHFGLLGKARHDAGELILRRVEPARFERLRGRHDALDRGHVEAVETRAGRDVRGHWTASLAFRLSRLAGEAAPNGAGEGRVSRDRLIRRCAPPSPAQREKGPKPQ